MIANKDEEIRTLKSKLSTKVSNIQREDPGRQDLLDRIPLAYQLSIAKLAKSGWIMTDTCNAATKFRKLFIESIKQVAIDRGMPARQIRIYEAGEYCSYCTTVANSYLN